MAEGLEQKAGGIEEGGISTNRRNRRNVEQWHNMYLEQRSGLSKENQNDLELYRDTVLAAIDKATIDDRLKRLENWEDVKECYSYELTIQGMDYLLTKRPSKNQVIKWAKGLTRIRKGSWFDSLIRQIESIQIEAKPFILQFDDEGEIVETGLPESGWVPPLNPPDPHKLNPEECLLRWEDLQKIQHLPSDVGSLQAKRASEWEVILFAWLQGKETTRRNAKELGIPEDEAISLKHQAKEKAKMIFAQNDEDVAEKQALCNVQKGKKHKIKRSTFEERKALFTGQVSEEKESRLIRHWNVISGGQTPILDPNRPVASEIVYSERREAA